MIVSTKYAMDKGMCLPEGVSKLLVLVQKYKMNEMCTVLDSGRHGPERNECDTKNKDR
jgi:hypothetical protein